MDLSEMLRLGSTQSRSSTARRVLTLKELVRSYTAWSRMPRG